MDYQVRLELYEGPLDLLLHLIRSRELDIYEIPIAEITDQYLAFLAQADALSLDRAGEFFLMAATLMRLKARQLLPRSEELGDGEEEEELISTPEDLQARLLEYEQFKEVAQHLGEAEGRAREVFGRGYNLNFLGEETLEDRIGDVGLYELMKAFFQVMERAKREPPVHEVEQVEVNLEERIRLIRDRIGAGTRIAFSELFEGMVRRLELIVTFVALLELVRLGSLRLDQPEPMGEIWVIGKAQ